jgi:transposase
MGRPPKFTRIQCEELLRLWNSGLSLRQASTKVGISRNTAEKIVAGEYMCRNDDFVPESKLKSRTARVNEAKLVRCPGCGGKVELPCRLCAANRHKDVSNVAM